MHHDRLLISWQARSPALEFRAIFPYLIIVPLPWRSFRFGKDSFPSTQRYIASNGPMERCRSESRAQQKGAFWGTGPTLWCPKGHRYQSLFALCNQLCSKFVHWLLIGGQRLLLPDTGQSVVSIALVWNSISSDLNRPPHAVERLILKNPTSAFTGIELEALSTRDTVLIIVWVGFVVNGMPEMTDRPS